MPGPIGHRKIHFVQDPSRLAKVIAFSIVATVAVVIYVIGGIGNPPHNSTPREPTQTETYDPTVASFNEGYEDGNQANPSKPPTTHEQDYKDGYADGKADRMGDDNRDGVVDEDESGFNCRTMGNRVCGPNAPADGYVNR
jgi:hypothetical protein